jgi:hypothetical protein
MGRIKRINRHGFQDEIELVAADDVGLGACAIVTRGPVLVAVLFDFAQELVGPQVFQLDLDVLGVLIEPVEPALHPDGGDGRFRAVDNKVDGNLEKRVN